MSCDDVVTMPSARRTEVFTGAGSTASLEFRDDGADRCEELCQIGGGGRGSVAEPGLPSRRSPERVHGRGMMSSRRFQPRLKGADQRPKSRQFSNIGNRPAADHRRFNCGRNAETIGDARADPMQRSKRGSDWPASSHL